jgi:enoyl-CoA hydratase
MSLTGDFIGAAEALRIGLVNHVVPHEHLLEVAAAKARAIAEQPRDMVAMLRKDWTATDRLPLEDGRRVHYEHAARGGFGAATGATIAARREAVMERARQPAPE